MTTTTELAQSWRQQAADYRRDAGTKMDSFSKIKRAKADQLEDCASDLIASAEQPAETLKREQA